MPFQFSKILIQNGECRTANIRHQDLSWPFWPAVPLYPYGQRRTLRQEIIKDTVWTFDQLQGILYVVVPIRMTAVKLAGGGLLIYAPVAPTPECVGLVRELEAQHGQVKYIILPTASGIEHKVFAGPFARQFPVAQVLVTPHQWSFPLNLPLSWLGLPAKRTHLLPTDSSQVPFTKEFDYQQLGPIHLGLGLFEEVVFYHKPSRTLLVTDSVLSVPEEPPEIVQLDPYPLLFHARESAFDPIWDSEANRRQGWQRTVLFTLYFRPAALKVIPWGEAFRHAFQGAERSKKAYFGLYPFQWQEGWQQSFQTLRGEGRLLVAPILQSLILNRAPQETIDWAGRVASWDFQRVIPCHFDSPIEAGPDQFRQAFAFLEKESYTQPLPEQDFGLLWKIEEFLNQRGILSQASKGKGSSP